MSVDFSVSRFPHWLFKPLLNLQKMAMNPPTSQIRLVAAIPGGGSFVYERIQSGPAVTQEVSKVNQQGFIVRRLFTCVQCNPLNVLILVQNSLFAILQNPNKTGTVFQMDVENGRLVGVNVIPDVASVTNMGSLSSSTPLTDTDLLILADEKKGEIFTYRLSTEVKTIRLTGLKRPTSVSISFHDNRTLFVVCESGNHRIGVYTSEWALLVTFGGQGSGDGQLNSPTAAVTTPGGTIIVADTQNNRISEFGLQGEFRKQLIPVQRPFALSFSFPHLFVVHDQGKMLVYKLYG